MSQYPRLGAILFGEGIINSALSIVLFKTFFTAYTSNRTLLLNGDSRGYTSPFDKGVSLGNVTLEVLVQLINSCLIGVFFALACSALFVWQKSLRLYPIHQTSMIMLFGYTAYALAEVCNYSGILSLFAASVCLSHSRGTACLNQPNWRLG